MLYGVMMGGRPVVTDEGEGMPIVEAIRPEVPDGYKAVDSWVETGGELRQVWALVPIEGTAAEAAIELARMQAADLSDAEAVKVAALYDEWSGEGVEYAEGLRLRFQGALVKVKEGHVSAVNDAPNAQPSKFSLIVADEGGAGIEVAVWDAGKDGGYDAESLVMQDESVWKSDRAGNTQKPGEKGAGWTKRGDWNARACSVDWVE